ncbi:MAG: hypothetical protein AB8I08_13195 [Sandaracinaceae bacterium]
MRLALAPILAMALAGVAPLLAYAQSSDDAPPSVAAGVQAYEAGDFERAATLFDAAEETGDLSRAEVVRILEHRAQIAQALNDEVALDRALLQLVTLAPDALSRAAPALVRLRDAALERTGGATIEVQLEHERLGDGTVRVRPRVRGDAGALVTAMRLRARVAGQPWPEPSPDAVTLQDDPEHVEATAEALGPGGAVLASIGTLDDPVPLVRRHAAPPEALETSDDTALHVGLVIGGAALVVAAVVVALVLAMAPPQPDSELGSPMVMW